MPLGDSITHGWNHIITDENYIVGYRQKLYLDLINSGYGVNFVGSLNSGMLAQPLFDFCHEGHGGWCTDACDPPYEGLREHIYDFLTNNPADVVLLHIGTNDIGMDLQDPYAVSRVLDEIYRYSPDIIVLLARIINRTDEKILQTTQFNDAVQSMAEVRPEYGETLFLVDMENALNYQEDMEDELHPNQNGYEKMANVWLEALYNILPLPNRLITVQKSGAGHGTVSSTPTAIDCGDTCSASLPQGTVVKLTATPEYGSALSLWVGCDEVDNNTCTVTLDSDRTVTVDFRTVTEVKLLSPNGGEIIPAGLPQYPITWEAPSEAVKFKLSGFSRLRIETNSTDVAWDVPLFKKNKMNCYVKVTAYDNAERVVGYDISDKAFTVEVVSITAPNQETICTGGLVCPITWTKSPYIPASSIDLYYSLNKGYTWKKMLDTPLPPDIESFDWVAPNVSGTKTKCKVKVVLRGSEGKVVGSAVSEGRLAILP